MNKYFATLAYYTVFLIITIAWVVTMAVHVHWWVLIPLMMIGVCVGCAYIGNHK